MSGPGGEKPNLNGTIENDDRRRTSRWVTLALCGALLLLIYLLSPILSPFLIAALLTYLGNPLVSRLQRWHIPRTIGAILVIVGFFIFLALLILLMIPLLIHQSSIFISYLSTLGQMVQDKLIPLINKYFGENLTFNFSNVQTTLAQNWKQTSTILETLWKTLSHSGVLIFEFGLNLILVPVVTFYLLRDWQRVITGMRNLLPRQIEPIVVKLAKDCNEVLGAFLRGQLLVMLSLGLVYAFGLSLTGLNMAFFIGIIAGLASVVPYLGFIVGLTIALIACLAQYQAWTPLIYVAIVFGIGQSLESMVLTPWLVGDRIGLHPVAVIFAIMAGGILFGFIGILLALPTAAVIMVLLRYAKERYMASRLYEGQHV